MARHLAVFDAESINLVFSGKKKIEGRFSQIKIPPFGKVACGDQVLMKVTGEKIVGQFTVDRVLFFDHPQPEELATLRRKYAKDMVLSKTFWLDHERVNYVTLMFIKSVSKFLVAPEVVKRDLRPWVVLE